MTAHPQQPALPAAPEPSLEALLTAALQEMLPYADSSPERRARIDALIDGIDLADTVALMRFGEPAFQLAGESGQRIARFVVHADSLMPQSAKESIEALTEQMELALKAARPPGWLARLLGLAEETGGLQLADRLPLLYMQVNQLALRLGHEERKLVDALPQVRNLFAGQLHAFGELGLYVAALQEKTRRVFEDGEAAEVERRLREDLRMTERMRLEAWQRSALRLADRAGTLMTMRHAVAADMLVLCKVYRGLSQAQEAQRATLDRDVAGWQQGIVTLAQIERQRQATQRIQQDRGSVAKTMETLLTDMRRTASGAPDEARDARLQELAAQGETLNDAMQLLSDRERKLMDAMAATRSRVAAQTMQRLDAAGQALESSLAEAARGAADPLVTALQAPAPSQIAQDAAKRAKLPAPRIPGR